MRTLLTQLDSDELKLLLDLQKRGLTYFLENQVDGLILDRQRNHGRITRKGVISTASTGMGLIAIALASKKEYKLLSRSDAIARVQEALQCALDLSDDHGMLPHFLKTGSFETRCQDPDSISTIDSSWLIAGGMVAANILRSPSLRALSKQLYDRVDWRYWSIGNGDGKLLISHGKGKGCKFLPARWDRLNAETVFMYVMASGAAKKRSFWVPAWNELGTFNEPLAGELIPSGSLGLFVFQYSLALLDLESERLPVGPDLIKAHKDACRLQVKLAADKADQYETFRHFWGLSAGDGPRKKPGKGDPYIGYCGDTIDGTAHIMATLASIEAAPELVALNLRSLARPEFAYVIGRYGPSNVNLDRKWISRDVVGIDVGAAVMAIDNALYGGRVRKHFHSLPCVKRAFNRFK